MTAFLRRDCLSCVHMSHMGIVEDDGMAACPACPACVLVVYFPLGAWDLGAVGMAFLVFDRGRAGKKRK